MSNEQQRHDISDAVWSLLEPHLPGQRERTVPVVGPVGDLGVDEVFVDELLLEFDVLLHAGIVGHVDGNLLPVDLPRLGAGLPSLRGEGLVFHGGARVVGHVGASGLDLLGGLIVVVPGLDLGAIDAGLLEDRVVVEEHFRAGINRQRVRLVVVLQLVPRACGEVVGNLVRTELAQVGEVTGDGELGDGRIFKHHYVRGALACGDGVAQCGLGVGGGTGVVEFHGDAGVGLLEIFDQVGHSVAGVPAPEHDLGFVGVSRAALAGVVGSAAAGRQTDEGRSCGQCRESLLCGAHVSSFRCRPASKHWLDGVHPCRTFLF